MNASLDPAHVSAATFAPARALLPGTVVDGFEIVRVVAYGDLSIEYVAIDRQRAADVVLVEYMPQRLARREGAVVRPQTPPDAEAFGRGLVAFVDEAHMLVRIHHPSLVRVTGVLQANATAYQITPLHAGTPLLHVRQAMDGPADERALRRLLDGVLDALDALHRHDELHGAVSPSSIMVLGDDRALLLGPERARAAVSSGLVESLMASVEPSFAAPEQRESAPSQPLGPWTDLYSLAETMRFCIGGDLPPPATARREPGRREPAAQMVRRLFGPLSPVHYSTGLLNALDAALETRPTARPQSVAEFRAALGKMPEDTPPVREPARVEPAFHIDPSPPAQAETPAWRTAAPHATFRPPPARRRRWWPWAGSAFALLLAVAAYGWWRFDPFAWVELPAAVIAPSTPIVPTPAPEPGPIAEPAPPPVVLQAPTPTPPQMEPQQEPPPQAQAPPQPTIVAAPTPAPPVRTKPAPPSPATPTSPRDACAGRTQFSLYRCMQALCEQRGWANHPQCERLRETDSVE